MDIYLFMFIDVNFVIVAGFVWLNLVMLLQKNKRDNIFEFSFLDLFIYFLLRKNYIVGPF